jgi:hypothetical protein
MKVDPLMWRPQARMEQREKDQARNALPSEVDAATAQKDQYILKKAQLQLEEEEDDIKRMNELILYAKCVAIRDAQMQEKKIISEETKMEEARMDAIMEADRVKELKRIREREEARKRELRDGASVIRKQIEERQEAALLEAERKDQETKVAMRLLAEENEKERQEKLVKGLAMKEHLKEIQTANAESINRKKQQKVHEQEEDKKLLTYLLEKEKLETERDELEKTRLADKEKELARLRASQQKVTSTVHPDLAFFSSLSNSPIPINPILDARQASSPRRIAS